MEILEKLYEMTAFGELIHSPGTLLMLAIAFGLFYLGIYKKYEPLLLVPIGFGLLLANFPGGNMSVTPSSDENGILSLTLLEIASEHGIMNLLYYALIKTGLLPPLIFMGVGAMTDFGPMLRNLRLAFFWGCCANWHFYSFNCGFSDWIHPGRICFTGYYWRCRRPHSHLYIHYPGPPSFGAHCHCRLFLYGTGSGDHTPGCQPNNLQQRIENKYEGAGQALSQ